MKTETYLADVRPAHTPDHELRPGVLHVFGDAEGAAYWYAALLCPCGCAAAIYVPLAHGSVRGWHLTIAGAVPTVREPLRRLNGCCTRFKLTAGQVVLMSFQP
jgi:hypothetical protein